MPGVPGPVTKPCDAIGDAEAAVRRADVVGVAHVAEMELVDQCSEPNTLVLPNDQQLRAADRQRVEAGHVGAALRAGIRIVEPVVVDEVVAGQQAEPAVAVDAERSLVVAHGLRERAGRKARSAPALGVGMYCSSCCAGADHARAGIMRVREARTAPRSTQPGV